MFITHEEMQRRLESAKNLKNIIPEKSVRVPNNGSVRHEPMHKITPAAPKEVKILAASLVGLGEKTKTVCKELGLSPKQVYSAKNAEQVVNTLDRVRELALTKTLIALGLMTDDKFENASLKDLSAVASNLSRVYEKTGTRENISNTVQFIVHSPQMKSLGQYQVLDV